MILNIPDAAVGAVAAAVVGGVLALVGLVIAKENKVSEFRQAWIDALRQDIAKMIASANVIRGAGSVLFNEKKAYFVATEKHFIDVSQAVSAIRLRINHDEPSGKLILDAIDRLEKLMDGSTDKIDIAACVACERAILINSRLHLKTEWKRVQRGEPAFQLLKWIVFLSILGGASLLFQPLVQH